MVGEALSSCYWERWLLGADQDLPGALPGSRGAGVLGPRWPLGGPASLPVDVCLPCVTTELPCPRLVFGWVRRKPLRCSHSERAKGLHLFNFQLWR